jgi:hypothetical protein
LKDKDGIFTYQLSQVRGFSLYSVPWLLSARATAIPHDIFGREPLSLYRPFGRVSWPKSTTELRAGGAAQDGHGGAGSVGDADLAEDVPEVRLHGPHAKAQGSGDLLIAEPLS